MILEARAVPPFYKNGFLLACEKTHEGVIIDPGDEVDDLLALVRAGNIRIRHILLTHGHVDHVSGVARAKAETGAPVSLHPSDRFLYFNAPQQARMFGLSVDDMPPPDDGYEQSIRFGRYELRVHPTPGHSPGGVCLELVTPTPATADGADTEPQADGRKQLFVGDTLFAGSIGRTDLPGGDYQTLIASIKDVLFRFGDAAIVHPGHGASTTIGAERRGNPFLVG